MKQATTGDEHREERTSKVPGGSDTRRRPAEVAVRTPWSLSPRASTARDPTRRLSYVSCVGLYDSFKMRLRFPFESLAEREAMVLLDVDPMVAAFRSQPETFRWRSGGRTRSYTPDLLVHWVDGRKEYLGVKPWTRNRADPDLKGRLERIHEECDARGAGFRPWTDRDIRFGERLANAKRVVAGHAFMRTPDAEAMLVILTSAIRASGLPTTLGELLVRAGRGRRMEGHVLGLVALGHLSMDLDEEVRDGSAIREGEGNPIR